MNPFKYIYLIYIIYGIAAGVYSCVLLFKFVENVTDEQIVDLIKISAKKNSTINVNNYHAVFGSKDEISEAQISSFKSTLEFSKTTLIFTLLFSFAIEIIYYITTKNYIKTVEKEEKEIEGVKNIENAY